VSFKVIIVMIIIIYLPTEHQGVHKNSFRKCPYIPGSNWNLIMFVFEERGTPEYLEKNLWEQRRDPTTNKQTYDAE